MTIWDEERLMDRRAGSIDWYTNCLDWLAWMKDEVSFKKFQMMLESMLNNWQIKVKEKVDLLMFIYPQFQNRVCEVKKELAKKNKELKFECKPMMSLIWGC